jgi:uncharacterized membrane-anchored protein
MFIRIYLTTLLALAGAASLLAQEAVGPATGDEQQTLWIAGPEKVELGEVAQLQVREGFIFADAENTRALMAQMGNPPSGGEMGLITPASDTEQWFIVFEWAPVGFVKDDDGHKIDADGLLKSIKEATDAANEQRRGQGSSALHVKDWIIPPYYDEKTHHLVWALEAVDDDGTAVVNYNLRMLGRRGYMSATLVTDPQLLEQHKSEIENVLAGYSFQSGGTYAEFVSGDKLAGYGLTALVAGGAGAAAAKLGLFAVLAKFLGKAWKAVVAAIIGLGALIKRLLGRGKGEDSIPPPPPLPPIPRT